MKDVTRITIDPAIADYFGLTETHQGRPPRYLTQEEIGSGLAKDQGRGKGTAAEAGRDMGVHVLSQADLVVGGVRDGAHSAKRKKARSEAGQA